MHTPPGVGAKINAAEKYIVDNKNLKHLFEDLVNPKKYNVGTKTLFDCIVNPKKYIVGTMMLLEYLVNPKKYMVGTMIFSRRSCRIWHRC